MKRQSLGKAKRFAIFQRDAFTCRYCGRTSEAVVLVVDHVIPVCKGGTNDDENLITACADCNSGKGSKSLDAAGPTETDILRANQERREIMAAAELAKQAAEATAEFTQTICNFWCEANRQKSMDRRTLSTMCSFARKHGVEVVFEWIQLAADRLPGTDDFRRGAYIGGIRRRMLEEGDL